MERHGSVIASSEAIPSAPQERWIASSQELLAIAGLGYDRVSLLAGLATRGWQRNVGLPRMFHVKHKKWNKR